MGESQPTLEMGPCLARHPQIGAYFRNCSNNLLLEHRVWRIEHCYTILRGGHIRSGGSSEAALSPKGSAPKAKSESAVGENERLHRSFVR